AARRGPPSLTAGKRSYTGTIVSGRDQLLMRRAIDLAAGVRSTTSPNPWEGAVLVTTDGQTFDGATEPPGGRHAEIVALDAAARPWVPLWVAPTVAGGTGVPDGSSRWITGAAARADADRLRAESDAVIVGAGTVRSDDPALTVRDAPGDDPLRVVLGHAPAHA